MQCVFWDFPFTDNQGDLQQAAYLLDQYNVVPGRRPIEKLAVLPTVGKAVILSGTYLYFLDEHPAFS